MDQDPAPAIFVTTKLILLDSLLQEIKSWGAQLKQRQNENTA
jgi:hypothetical protein